MLEFRRLQIGAELEVKEIGYLRLAPDGDALDAFEASVRLQRAFGIDDSAVLSADDVRELVPGLRGPAIAGGLWGPHDGRIDGRTDYCRILAGSAVARRQDRTGERVIEASSRASGWRLQTTNGVIECDVVVNAAGPWAAQIGELLGVHVPVILSATRSAWRLTQPLDRALPMVMDYIPHTGTRGRYVATYDDAEHVLAGLHSEEIDDAGVDPDAYDREAIRSTSPTRGRPWNAAYRSCRLATSNEAWSRALPGQPDGLPIVGPAPRVPNVILAIGGGGSGIQLSPIMGALPTGSPMASLDPSRTAVWSRLTARAWRSPRRVRSRRRRYVAATPI